MPLNVGQTIHNERYRIDGLLGQGGMGAVYRAWDLNLQVPVALKENLEASTEARSQFIREARILARLVHPNLPRVSDYFFIPEQGQYLVMDYVEGEDLQQMLDRRGALPEEQALEWARQVSDALAYLHTQPTPVIHRDIKPANIRIRPDGRAMLVDFGIAKIFDPQGSTTVGAKAVTPGYSPPEQYGGGRTDARSDVYAIGATLYHLLTGQAPPESVQLMTNMASVTPPRQFNPSIRPSTEAAILRAMQVSTDRRFQSAAELKQALTRPAVQDEPQTLVSAPRLHRQAPLERTLMAPQPAQEEVYPRRRTYSTAPGARAQDRPSAPPPAQQAAQPAAAGPNRALQILLGLVGFAAVIGACALLLFFSGVLGGDGLSAIFGQDLQPTHTEAAAVLPPTGAAPATQPPEAPTQPPVEAPTDAPIEAPAEDPPAAPTEPPAPLPPPTEIPTLVPTPTSPPPPTPTKALSSFGLISQGWSMGGGNSSNSSWNAAETILYPPLELEWQWQPSDSFNFDTITVAGEVFYVGGSHNGGDDNAAYAVRVGTSEPLWSFIPPAARGANDVHVAVGGGLAFFGGQQDDSLYCLNALTGALLYSVPGTGGMYTRPPKVVKGRVYAPSSNGIMAVNAQDGSVLWRTEGGRVQSNNAMIGGSIFTGAYLDRADGTMDVTALDIQSGAELWRSWEARAIKVAADQSKVYAVVSSTNSFDLFDTVVAYNNRTGAVEWRQLLGWNVWFFSDIAITDDKVFVAGSARDVEPQRLFVLDKSTGALLHRVEIPGQWTSALAVANGVLYVGTNQGLWAFDTQRYSLLWEKGMHVSDLAISEGRLFIAAPSYVVIYSNP